MKHQKLTAGLLALAMLGISAPETAEHLILAASAAESDFGTLGNLNWSFDSSTGTLTISGDGEMTYETVDGETVYPWQDYQSQILSVVIEQGVNSIGFRAFYNCNLLTSVTIPDSVTSIGGNAFSGTPWLYGKRKEDPLVIVNNIVIDGLTCSGDVVIPDDVIQIGNAAFSSCDRMTSVTIPDSVTNIGDYAFFYCSELTSVTIPNSVSHIGEAAFESCSSLTAVSIPNRVTDIGSWAFSNCTGLTEITFPDSVENIGNAALNGCTSLTSVTILNPNCTVFPSDTTINNGMNADYNYFYDGVIRGYYNSTAQEYAGWYDYGFETLGFAPVDTPTSGTWGELNWNYDETAKTLTISGEGKMAADENFTYPWDSYRSDACSVVIENGVTNIAACAFSWFSDLTSVTIPESVTSIGYGAFHKCGSLTGITLREHVTTIDSRAFSECKNLTDVTILNPACKIGADAGTFSNGLDDDYNYFYSGTIHGYADSTSQTYAELYGCTFAVLSDTPTAGDVNGDKSVDASDAADLLIALANIGAGADSGLTDAQTAAADADGSGALDAGDAAVILQYAAYLGSGGTGTLDEFLNS